MQLPEVIIAQVYDFHNPCLGSKYDRGWVKFSPVKKGAKTRAAWVASRLLTLTQ